MSVKHPVAWLPVDGWEPAEGVTVGQVRHKLISLLDAASTESGRIGILVRSSFAAGQKIADEISADPGTELGRAAIAEKMAEYTALPIKRVLGLVCGIGGRHTEPPTAGQTIGWALLDVIDDVAMANSSNRVVELFYD